MQIAGSKTAVCLGLGALLAWPAIYNGQPFFSADTSAYIRGFDAGIVWLLEIRTSWTSWAAHLVDSKAATPSTIGQAASLQSPTYIIAGRSVTYGALLYIGELLGGLWATVLIQASVTYSAIALTLRHFEMLNRWLVALTAIVLALLTTLPFFVSFMLPDIFAGLAVLAIANVVVFGDRMARSELIFWLCVLVLSAIFHPTHLGIILTCIAIVATAWLAGAKVARVCAPILLLSAAAGITSELTFNLVMEGILGVQVSRPPVVAARIIADGPGAAYLQERCPAASFTLCEFKDRGLLANSDAFLWGGNSREGAYSSASIEKRREMGREQYRFAAAVLAYDPVGQIRASLSDGLQQLTMIGLDDFANGVANLPDYYGRQWANSAVGKDLFPLRFFSVLTSIVAISSTLFITATFVLRRRTISPELKLFCTLLVVSLLANAIICGALSGPHQRYQARLAWLVPFAAIIVYYEIVRQRLEAVTPLVGGRLKRAETPIPRGQVPASVRPNRREASLRSTLFQVNYLSAVTLATAGWLFLIAWIAGQWLSSY